MEGYLRLVLLLIIGIGLTYLFLKSRARKRRAIVPLEPSPPKTDAAFFSAMGAENLLAIYVFSKNNNRFVSYDLLQAISATGMQFGHMNIFHYYQRNPRGKKIVLFSLASATKPGVFDLDKMGAFSCVGLTLFMDIADLPNPLQAFYLMVSAAEHLADDLDGELRASPNMPWNEVYFKAYEQKIMHLQPEKV